MSVKKQLFDNAAASYDTTFTKSHIGRFQRARVYSYLSQIDFFKRVKSVFEINCGTGADATYFHENGLEVTATDRSTKMIEAAKNKGTTGINFFPLDFSKLAEQEITADALFSNFGGLNCVPGDELKTIASTISNKQQKGDLIIWVIMPRFCFMEGMYFLSRLKFGKLFRRNTAKAVAVNVDGTAVETFYHSPRFVKRVLNDTYKIEKVKPVAFFLPPSYLEGFFKNKWFLLNFLNRLEKIAGRMSFLSGWSDHYIIIGVKK
ncbi:MAG: methyltransferase domain-containing protein [Crocinitomix sp.]|nr:methyltransferase domain-containing protein [Crocinitomix sp.]